VARLIQSLGQFDADMVLEDRRWPMARPYRRIATAPIEASARPAQAPAS
jgi:hypothetical protein